MCHVSRNATISTPASVEATPVLGSTLRASKSVSSHNPKYFYVSKSLVSLSWLLKNTLKTVYLSNFSLFCYYRLLHEFHHSSVSLRLPVLTSTSTGDFSRSQSLLPLPARFLPLWSLTMLLRWSKITSTRCSRLWLTLRNKTLSTPKLSLSFPHLNNHEECLFVKGLSFHLPTLLPTPSALPATWTATNPARNHFSTNQFICYCL